MVYVGYVLEKLLDVNAIIDSCYVRPLYACAYSGLRYTIVIIGGNDWCFTKSHALAVPRDTTGVCAKYLLWTL